MVIASFMRLRICWCAMVRRLKVEGVPGVAGIQGIGAHVWRIQVSAQLLARAKATGDVWHYAHGLLCGAVSHCMGLTCEVA